MSDELDVMSGATYADSPRDNRSETDGYMAVAKSVVVAVHSHPVDAF